MRRRSIIAIGLLLGMLLVGCHPDAQHPAGSLAVDDWLGGDDTAGYARATEARAFRFPGDHGPHPEFRNEWWYLTGHLDAADGKSYGFQVTFFRVALSPQHNPGESDWRTRQVWMAHAALSDISRRQHQAEERFARQAIGLAGATATPFRVWLEDWQLAANSQNNDWLLQVPADEFSLQLRLRPQTPIIAQGEHGLSQKSAAPGNASFYYSIPRLQASGQLSVAGQLVDVSGLAWLDREWSTSALGADQQGWDWFSLQLDDGRNLMYYQLRRKDGSRDPHSSGSISDESGLIRRIIATDVQLEPIAYWQNDERRYPVEWRMHMRGEPAWRLKALFPQQEMRLSVRYWEGAIEISEEKSGKPLGRGYLEMAGYR